MKENFVQLVQIVAPEEDLCSVFKELIKDNFDIRLVKHGKTVYYKDRVSVGKVIEEAGKNQYWIGKDMIREVVLERLVRVGIDDADDGHLQLLNKTLSDAENHIKQLSQASVLRPQLRLIYLLALAEEKTSLAPGEYTYVYRETVVPEIVEPDRIETDR